jgi:hypothetical protein
MAAGEGDRICKEEGFEFVSTKIKEVVMIPF